MPGPANDLLIVAERKGGGDRLEEEDPPHQVVFPYCFPAGEEPKRRTEAAHAKNSPALTSDPSIVAEKKDRHARGLHVRPLKKLMSRV